MTLVSFVQFWNVALPIFMTLLPIVRFVRPLHPRNELLPRLVTLFGIITLVTVNLFKNAEFPMMVTGKPFVALGMPTIPPEPL